MQVVQRVADIRNILKGISEKVIFVPTMGALHAGHEKLIQDAKELGGFVVVSVYVNPTQFGSGEDLLSYPRLAEADTAICEKNGVDVLFMPETKDIYGDGKPQIRLTIKSFADVLCGKDRPSHFNGVVQVLTRLFNIVKPDVALFGQKDYQQLLVVKRLVSDLLFPIEIIGVPTVREKDGLAMSSRNVNLSLREREIAPILHKTLQWIKSKAETARFDRRALPIEWAEDEAKKWLKTHEPDVEIDYIEVLNNDDLTKGQFLASNTHAFGAIRIGKTRLIDNIALD
ncbi:pantoate--beta-alanine ligase [bacterium]|nr:pantoate--beta-alanine ligase [bacterium]